MDRSEEVAAIEPALATLLATIDRQHTKLATIDQQHDSQNSSPLEDLLEDLVGQSCRLGLSRLARDYTSSIKDARDHERR